MGNYPAHAVRYAYKYRVFNSGLFPRGTTTLSCFIAGFPRGFSSRILHRRALPYAIDNGASLLPVRKLKHTVNKVASLRDCH
ncbi:MAG: hypothetical protein LBF39_02385, partial [Prevotellaceae bacterium]|nr:hypothetical protein [Prevotellaceae bacterium]